MFAFNLWCLDVHTITQKNCLDSYRTENCVGITQTNRLIQSGETAVGLYENCTKHTNTDVTAAQCLRACSLTGFRLEQELAARGPRASRGPSVHFV